MGKVPRGELNITTDFDGKDAGKYRRATSVSFSYNKCHWFGFYNHYHGIESNTREGIQPLV